MKAILLVGTGGFTILSAVAYESASLAHEARLNAALLNIALQVIVGLLAVGLGRLMARLP